MLSKWIIVFVTIFILFSFIGKGRGFEIYADHYEKNDIPFMKDQSLPNFILKAGFFVDSAIPQYTIYNKQLGINYISEQVSFLIYNIENHRRSG